MRNPHPRYMCFPSVLCVGRETKVSIVARDISRIFREEKSYTFGIFGMRDDVVDYRKPLPLNHPFTVENGCLCFTFTPENEQEYSVRFREAEGQEIRISLYAVHSDLYALRPLKGDLHSHSYYSDGTDGVAMTPSDFREEGFDFFALTDHNRLFTSQAAIELYHGIPLGMHIMTGEEVHPQDSSLHIVGVGQTESVCNHYIHNAEAYEAELDELEKELSHVPEQYRRRTAMAKWSCNTIRKNGGLAILAHPFWMPNTYNYSEEFVNILFQERIFDAVELLNGVCKNGKINTLHLALWQEQTARGYALPPVGCSDAHNHDFSTTGFGRNFTVVFAEENTTPAILSAIRGGYCVAGEIPREADNGIRFYGHQLRFVAFAHFLYENYFNETWRLCIGEGILMRRYAEGEPVADLLAAHADTVETFYKRFYGLLPAPVLPKERLDFLDACLMRQRTEGPPTKGSAIVQNGRNQSRE